MSSGKTLPCFAPYDAGARSGGFIGDRFLTGEMINLALGKRQRATATRRADAAELRAAGGHIVNLSWLSSFPCRPAPPGVLLPLHGGARGPC